KSQNPNTETEGGLMEIDLEKLPFDLDFHPSSPLVTVGLITGDLHLYAAIGTQPEKVFEIHAHEESCKAVRFINGGTGIISFYLFSFLNCILYSSSHFGLSLQMILIASPIFSIRLTDVQTGATIARLDNAHEAAVNRLVNLTEITIASGDDNGCIKVWDTRQRTCCNSFDAHEEYISDMIYAADSLKLLGTSGDGTLSICSLRKNKVLTQSEFSEDSPLSIVLMKNLCEIDKNCDVYDILKRSLFMVGETGGNDYNYAFLQGKSIEDATALVPLVVNNIETLPRLEYPNVAILYADYYQASEWVLTNAPQLGFETKSILKVCCGTGGDYNFSLMSMYGMEGVFACSDPDQYINWDGVHLTEKAHQSMADWLIKSQVFECIV
ncbi:hypothetical protein IFM89_005580, partial [Coptis chinensis]